MKRFYFLIILMIISLLIAIGGKSAPIIYFRLFYLLALLLVASILWSYFNLRKVEVSIERPHGHLEVGDILQSNITVRNPTSFHKLNLDLTDLTRLPGHQSSTLISLPPHTAKRWNSKTTLHKRGTYLLGDLSVTSSDPFGVYQRSKIILSTDEVTIYPRVLYLPGLYIPIKEMRGAATHRLPSSDVTPVYANVREYLPGDALKSIHWPATAHRGRLMARQFDREIDNQLWILLDLEGAIQEGNEINNTEEMTVTVAASIIARFIQEGWAVGIIAQGDRWYHISAHKGSKLDRYLDTLANMRAHGEVPFDRLIQGGTQFLPATSCAVIAITASLRPEWVDSVSELRERNAIVSAVFVDPITYGAPGDSANILQRLNSRAIDTYLVQQGSDLSSALDSSNLHKLPVPLS